MFAFGNLARGTALLALALTGCSLLQQTRDEVEAPPAVEAPAPAPTARPTPAPVPQVAPPAKPAAPPAAKPAATPAPARKK